MNTKPKLTPQVPGTPAPVGVNSEAIAPLLELDDVDLIQGLSTLSGDELDHLDTLAKDAGGRAAVNRAIAAEQTRRTEDEASGAQKFVDPSLPRPRAAQVVPDEEARDGTTPANLGDQVTYSKMKGEQVDPNLLDGPVLTRDGWVVPTKMPGATPLEVKVVTNDGANVADDGDGSSTVSRR